MILNEWHRRPPRWVYRRIVTPVSRSRQPVNIFCTDGFGVAIMTPSGDDDDLVLLWCVVGGALHLMDFVTPMGPKKRCNPQFMGWS